MERSSGAVRTACDIQIDGRRGGGAWRSAVRSAMVAVSRIPRRGTTDVDDVPAPA